MDKSKGKNIVIVILVITTIIASSLALYFGLVKNKQLKNQNSEYEAKIDELNSILDKNHEDDNDKEAESIENTNAYTRKIIDSNSKCLNQERVDIDGFVTAKIESENYASVSLEKSDSVGFSYSLGNLGKIFPSFADSNAREGIFTNVEIPFQGKKVADVFIKGFGQSYGYETVFFLMEDGTVEYMPVIHAIRNNNFKSYGTVEGVKDVVTIESFTVGNKNGGGGYTAVFAITSNNEYYELNTLIEKADFYNLYQ